MLYTNRILMAILTSIDKFKQVMIQNRVLVDFIRASKKLLRNTKLMSIGILIV